MQYTSQALSLKSDSVSITNSSGRSLCLFQQQLFMKNPQFPIKSVKILDIENNLYNDNVLESTKNQIKKYLF